MNDSRFDVSVVDRVAAASEREWDALDRGSFPFFRHAFLRALEETHCVGPGTGWTPLYVLVRDHTGALVAASASFGKTHSYGEYVFDYSWAEAYESSGRPYYPKLAIASPFVPATGPRVLIAKDLSDPARESAFKAVVEAWRSLAGAVKASSAHVLFTTPSEAEQLRACGFAIRKGFQFKWRNGDYRDFGDFTSALRSKRRRETRREREQACEGLEIERFTGSDLKPEHADAMKAFYRATVSKRGGYPYLTDAFFDRVFADLRDCVLFVQAREGSRPIAGSVGFYDGDQLFGRWWGCIEDRRALHFEVSYYQGIEWGIANGVSLFEAGAQGEHKLARGFLPEPTYSAHLFFDSRFAQAVESFCLDEAAMIELAIDERKKMSPFERI